MAYKLRCKDCGHTYIAEQRYFNCERRQCRSTNTSFVEEALDLAVDVAIAYTMVDVASGVFDGVGDLIGGLFD